MNHMHELLRINNEILGLISQLGDPPHSEPGWNRTLMAIAGACYSLGQAHRILNARRAEEYQIRDCKNLLTFFDRKQSFDNVANTMEEYKCWFVGYFLNSAELRIQSALERLFTIFVGDREIRNEKNKASKCKDKQNKSKPVNEKRGGRPDTITLAIQVIRRTYPQGGNQLRKQFPFSFEIMKGWENSPNIKELFNFSRHKSKAIRLKRVWVRVNSFKHDPNPRGDQGNILIRFRDAVSCLQSLLIIYKDFYHTKHQEII